MIKKEWWLAAGAVSAAMSGQNALAQAAGPERAGVAAAVNPGAAGQLGAGPSRVVLVASDVFRNERIVTDASGQAHLLFLDESAVTLGPNSEIVLDKFVYDPQSNQGELAITATRGAMRFIGGKLSKVNPIEIKTQTATIGVRGATAFYDKQADGVELVALGADGELTLRSNKAPGVLVRITTTGWGVQIKDGVVGEQFKLTVEQFKAVLALMNGPRRGNRDLTRRVTGNSDQTPDKADSHRIQRTTDSISKENANAPAKNTNAASANTSLWQQNNEDNAEKSSGALH